MRNTADKSQLKDILQNTWPIFLKTVRVIQSKESLENCQSEEEPKETLQLNVMLPPKWDPETGQLGRSE